MVPRSRLAFTLLVLLSALGSPRAGWPQSGPDLFEKGVERYRSGDYREAQRLLREYVDARGHSRRDAARLGEAYHYLGLMTPDAGLAKGYFLAVAQRYPTSPLADESVARLAQLYAAQANYAEARQQWLSLARDYPLSRFVPEVDLRVGKTYFADERWEPAYDAFSSGFSEMKTFQRTGGRGADLRALEGEYVYWLGRTLLARRAFGDARKYLNLVLLDYPGHAMEPLALYYLAESYRDDGKRREADDAWRRFSESVRNTSLESVAETPSLVAVAQARESGALRRPGDETAGAGERRGARDAELQPRDVEPAEASREEAAREPGAGATPGPGAEPEAGRNPLTGTGRERSIGEDRESVTEDDLRPPEEGEGLRAPEPGRPGGIVPEEPLGRRVEAEPPGEDAARRTPPSVAGEERGRNGGDEAGAERSREAAADSARQAQVLRQGQRVMRGQAPAAEPAPGAADRRGATAPDDAAGRAAVTPGRPARAAQPARPPEPPRPAQATPRPPAAGPGRASGRSEAAPPSPGGRPGEPARAGQPAVPLPAPPAAERVRPGQPAAPAQATPPGSQPVEPGAVYLQAGAFRSAQSAAEFAKTLRKKKFEPSVQSSLVDGKGYYRVRFGPYELPRDGSVLERTRTALLKAGVVPVVMKDESSE